MILVQNPRKHLATHPLLSACVALHREVLHLGPDQWVSEQLVRHWCEPQGCMAVCRCLLQASLVCNLAAWQQGMMPGAADAEQASGDWSSPGLAKPDDQQQAFFKLANGTQVQQLTQGNGAAAVAGDRVMFEYVLRRSNGYFIYSCVPVFATCAARHTRGWACFIVLFGYAECTERENGDSQEHRDCHCMRMCVPCMAVGCIKTTQERAWPRPGHTDTPESRHEPPHVHAGRWKGCHSNPETCQSALSRFGLVVRR
jgi:hypothetical protein